MEGYQPRSFDCTVGSQFHLGHVSSSRLVKRSVRISRAPLSCLLHPKVYEFRLAVYPPPQALQTSGAFIMSPLPSMLPEEVQTAGSLCSAVITPLHSSYGP